MTGPPTGIFDTPYQHHDEPFLYAGYTVENRTMTYPRHMRTRRAARGSEAPLDRRSARDARRSACPRSRRSETCPHLRPSPHRRQPPRRPAVRGRDGDRPAARRRLRRRQPAHRRQAGAPQRAQPAAPRTPIGTIYASAQPGPGAVRTRGATRHRLPLLIRDGTLSTTRTSSGARARSRRFGPDDHSIDASVLGTYPSSDPRRAEDLDPPDTPITSTRSALADSSRVKLRRHGVAIGHPFGLDLIANPAASSPASGAHIPPPTASRSTRSSRRTPRSTRQLRRPAARHRARVIGVNSQIATAGQTGNGNVGTGFAVPSNTARRN